MEMPIRLDLLREQLIRMDYLLTSSAFMRHPYKWTKQFQQCQINFGLLYKRALKTRNYMDLN